MRDICACYGSSESSDNPSGQKIKQAAASSYIAPGVMKGKASQICDLDRDDQIETRDDGAPIIQLHERIAFSNATARADVA
jgi:hypothetical protein